MSTGCRLHLCPAALLLVVAISCLTAHTDAVDCRKFVFAPVCRGIIAKRVVSTEKRSSSVRPEPSPRQWRVPYGITNSDNDNDEQQQQQQQQLLVNQSYEDLARLENNPTQEMILVRSGNDVVQVPAYVYSVIERSLIGERK